MKKTLFIAIAIISCLLLTSCGHQVGVIGIGTGFRVGGGEYGVSYGDGLFGTFVSKDGVNFKAEIDATQGFSFDPSTNSYKGIKSIEYSVAPQINGYAVEFSKENPEVAKTYYEALVKYYEIRKETVTTQPPLISDDKSTSASDAIREIVAKAIAKAKELLKGKEDNVELSFQCNGNCSYEDLSGNGDIEYQLSIAMKLLTYDGYTNKFEDTGIAYTTGLENFVTKLVKHQAKGNKETPLRVKYVTVENNVITKLMFVHITSSGARLTSCPNCEDLDFDF